MAFIDFLRLDSAVRKEALVDRLGFIQRELGKKRGTKTSQRMIKECLRYQRQYYERLLKQLERGKG